MLFILQLFIYCAVFTLTVKLAVRDNPINGLYFYPKPVQEKVYELGLANRKTVAKNRTVFMILFYIVMLVSLILIIGLWNRISDFWTAYIQSLIFLEVMNWYDGIVIDKIWVGSSEFWIIPGTENIPFAQTWKQVFIKRGILTIIWVIGAFIVTGLIVLIF